MKADQIQVGGTYQAKVNNKLTTVRVDAIDDISSGTRYHVTNLTTNRKTVFKSAAKFRSLEGEQRPNPTVAENVGVESSPTKNSVPTIVPECGSTENAQSTDKHADVVIDTSFNKSSVFKQWEEAKAKHPEMICLFRMGDFYEAYGDDAKTLGKVLGLTVTTCHIRQTSTARIVKADLLMSGFPHHPLETYLHKLLREGHRVAVCEQVEEKEIKQALKSEGEQSRPFPVPSVESLSPSSATSSPTSSKSGLASRLATKEDNAPHVIVEALAGCLAADTIINMNRAGRGSQIPIEKLVKQFSGEQPTYVRSDTGTTQRMRPWDLSIPTMLARAEGSIIKLGQLESAWCSGMKETFSLTTETGRTIRATKTHPFLTENGEWKLLKDLRVGDVLQVNAGRSKKGNGPKMQYRYTLTKFHPNQVVKSVGSAVDGGNYCGVLTHRLVIEAEMNGMTLKELVWTLRHDAEKTSKLSFLRDDQIVHHKNEDTFDNSLRNLEVLSSKDHSSRHNWGNNVLWQVGFEEIASVEPYGVELTYDLGMADDPHNFLANGFVVHNSGKTTTLIEGLRFVMGGESKLTPSPQQRQVWDSMALSKGIARTIGMCAFNKAIATELQSRVPQGVEALTMHSMGFRAIRKSFPRVDAGDRGKWRVNNFLCDILQVDSREVRKDPKLSALVRTTENLVALAKMNLTCMGIPMFEHERDSTRASLNDLIEYYDIDVNGSRDKILDIIPQVIERCKDVSRDNLIDFNDMVWLPVALDLPMQQYDMLLVDECVPGNTLVTLADGSQIEIRKMVESDKEFSVKAFNIKTGKNKACRVVAKQKIPNNKPMVRIQSRKRRSTKSEVETIECTVDHLIWTTNRRWVNAGSISLEDKLLTPSGQVSIVYSVEPYTMDEECVYDITVENCHNFYANGILVHNCQDLSKVQQELALRSGKRLIFVGDKKQSIYSFAGSDSKSMESLHERLGESQRGLQVIPLTVTRRCGKAIVKEAQAYVPAFEAHESNPEGVITEALYTLQKTIDGLEELPWEKTYGPLVKAGDMVLCRHNAPLVSQCFKFLKRGIKANIQGRDVGQGLSSLIRKLAGKEYDGGDKPMLIAEFVGRLDDWLHAEIDKEQAKKHPNENRIVGLQDKVDCILAFSDGVTNTTQILTKIDSVFTDDRKSPGVRFSSGHKAKGLEARRVFILDPVALRFQRKKQADWEREQNNNLRYVMITRAIEELCYVV